MIPEKSVGGEPLRNVYGRVQHNPHRVGLFNVRENGGSVGAQSVEYLPRMHQDLAFIPAPHKPGVVEYTWNLLVWEVEAGRPGFQGQSSVT